MQGSTTQAMSALPQATFAVQRIYNRGGAIEQRQNDDMLPYSEPLREGGAFYVMQAIRYHSARATRDSGQLS